MCDAPRRQRTANSRVGPAEYYELSSDDGRPAALLKPWPHGMMERHDGIAYELVQALDAPVLQTVEQLLNVVQFFSTQLPVVAEPDIAVPKILPHDVPPRSLCRDTQLAEQLVEVPTILYFLKQRIPRQLVDNPVPHGGRGASAGLQGFLPGHVEQTVDFPAPCSSVRRLQRFLPEQSLLLAGISGHYFLSPFLTVPLRGGYASVLEAFGQISQHFPSWSCRATLGLTVDTYSSSACGWLWKNF